MNGFNYRVAEDIIYQYALDSKRSFEYAERLIERYEAEDADVISGKGDHTKGTATMLSTFRDLAGMSEDGFNEILRENRKNFIGYSETSYNEFKKAYDELTTLVLRDFRVHNGVAQLSTRSDYRTFGIRPNEINSSIIYEGLLLALISQKGEDEKEKIGKVLSCILDKFPIGRDSFNILGEARKSARATELSLGFSRKMFILCFFARFILKWSQRRASPKLRDSGDYYRTFVMSLNSVLSRCSYSVLYPLHQFDWLILKSVKTLDDAESHVDMGVVELFIETLKVLANEQE